MGTENDAVLDDLDEDIDEGAEAPLPEWLTEDVDVEVEVEDDTPEVVEEQVAVVPPPVEEQPDVPDGVVSDADLEAGDSVYPESIKKRIKREIRIRKKIEAEAAEIRTSVVRAIEYAKTRDSELTATRQQFQELQRQHAEVLEITFEGKITALNREIRTAREDSDYDKEQTLQDELATLRYQQQQVREARRGLANTPAPQPPPVAQAPVQRQAPRPAPQPQRAPPEPLAVAWIDSNKGWFNNPTFAGHRQFVIGVDKQLVAEGYNPKSRDYYAELDRRVDGAFPTLRKAPVATTGAPVAPAGGVRTSASPSGRTKVTLNSTDIANMRKFGMDPTNKIHLREYAANKRRE